MIAIEVFSCTRMQIKKSEPQSFKDIARIIGINPENILFLDDSHKNILAAQEAGLRVVHFESNAQAIQDMKKLLQT
jgi:putative hydrolase of the HAD superfamily